MQPCIVKQPIHDADGSLWAYEILYSGAGDSPLGDEHAAAMLQALLLQCNTETFLENKTAFVMFTEKLMRRGIPKIFTPESLVIEIEQEFLLLSDAMRLVQEYHAEGYKVALVGFDCNARYLSALNMVDYVKLNFHNASFSQNTPAELLRGLGKIVIGQHVDDEDAFQRAKKAGVTHMQGSYIASTIPKAMHSMSLVPSNFFRLIVAITKEEPNFDEIEEIIARDVTLTYSLLKLVNSAFFALRTHVTSVHQALVILGLEQLKQWIYLLSFHNDATSAPAAFIKTSLMRASFCEALCDCLKDMPISRPEAYLMGLFSTLGALLDMPLSAALSELNLSAHIEEALLGGAGRGGMLYQLVLSYERADWRRISELATELDISLSVLSQKYFECMNMVNQVWRKISEAL